VIVAQVRQILGEVREVVAGADLEVLAELAVNSDQRTAAALIAVGKLQHSGLRQAFPVLAEPPVWTCPAFADG